MNLEKSIGEVVAEDYRTAEVFKNFGIDFCCGGKKTVQEVCSSKGIDYSAIKRELLQIESRNKETEKEKFNEWRLDALADYIAEKHHAYVKQSIPLLLEFSKKVATVHGKANPEVVEIARLFQQVAHEMQQHMMKEERVLFPYIKALALAKVEGNQPVPPQFGTVRNPIQMMEAEHDRAGNLMNRIGFLSKDYTPPAHACNTYRLEYHKLKEFEEDLHRHVHLENNILFPKAVKMETEFFGGNRSII